MSGENRFPEKLLLNEPDRGHRLIQEFYQDYADVAKAPNYRMTNDFPIAVEEGATPVRVGTAISGR
jgi:uncharacterized pyridoxal phosphate-containing UPF0001 family protein